MAQLIPADNTQPVRTITPKDGRGFEYEELKNLLGNVRLQFIDLPDGRYLICDEEGLFADHPVPNRRVAEFLPIPTVRELQEDLRKAGVDAYLGPPLSADPLASAYLR